MEKNIPLMLCIRVMRPIMQRIRNKMSNTEHASNNKQDCPYYFMNLRASFVAESERARKQNADEFSRRRCGLSGISRLRRGIWTAMPTAFLVCATRCGAPFIIPSSLRHYRIILFLSHFFLLPRSVFTPASLP